MLRGGLTRSKIAERSVGDGGQTTFWGCLAVIIIECLSKAMAESHSLTASLPIVVRMGNNPTPQGASLCECHQHLYDDSIVYPNTPHNFGKGSPPTIGVWFACVVVQHISPVARKKSRTNKEIL